MRFIAAAVGLFFAGFGYSQQPGGPLSPRDELATFRIPKGFAVDLVASEPDVVDPVACCFDARGRLFVCEMRGYPNGGVGTGYETRGRIRLLEDRHGDGVFETATTFAEGLRFPMGITPWKNGVIVAVAPDIIFLEDTTGTGKADKKTVLYTGFNLANIQQMVNGLTWGPDNWVHGVAGNSGGTVRSVQKPDAPPVPLLARGFRFDPAVPGSLEPESGGGQYGLAFDPFGHVFTNTNSQHLRQILIPDHALRRNPDLPVTATTSDIPDHGAACRVFRISPFEAWRVERTTRRAGGADAKRFPQTELVPGGFITSACSPLNYAGGAFPAAYAGNSFVCEPANNLVHRDVLDYTRGAAAVAKRADDGCEFLASTDNWFRPVFLCHGPDGAVYLLDFYREVIETPLSLPDDLKAKLNLESRDRGRIWRISAAGGKRKNPQNYESYRTAELVDELLNPNAWVRGTARRLLLERGEVVARASLSAAARGTEALPDVLSTLHGKGRLTDPILIAALSDPLPGNRGFAVTLAEDRLLTSTAVRAAAAKLADDPSPDVRFRLALALGAAPVPDAVPVLMRIAARDGADPWVQTAVLLSARSGTAELIGKLLDADSPAAAALLPRAATVVAGKGDDAAIARLLGPVLAKSPGVTVGLAAVLDGLAAGSKGKGRGLAARLEKPSAELAPIVAALKERFDLAVTACDSETLTVAAARLLAHAPNPAARAALGKLLSPRIATDVQLAAVRSLSTKADSENARALLAAWPALGPSVRREVQEQLTARAEWANLLLDAVAAKKVAAGELDPARIAQLKSHPAAAVRMRAAEVLAGVVPADRKKLIDAYAPALDRDGDPAKGVVVFKSNCATCHKLDGAGHEVGPDLRATVPGKTKPDILVAVLDPNREVDARYLSYTATLLDGRQLTGLLAAEGPGSVTLRRADGVEDVIRRADIDTLKSAGVSLMPEGLEKAIPAEAMNDLLAYLVAATKPK
jgi:putative membrane-bound dehydrogenase-like protein